MATAKKTAAAPKKAAKKSAPKKVSRSTPKKASGAKKKPVRIPAGRSRIGNAPRAELSIPCAPDESKY